MHKSLEVIEDKAIKCLERDITKNYWSIFFDGTNFKIQRRGSTEKEPTLVDVGIDESNCTSILALQPGQKDNAVSWGSVFEDHIKRGFDANQVQIGTKDELPDLENKFEKKF